MVLSEVSRTLDLISVIVVYFIGNEEKENHIFRVASVCQELHVPYLV